MKNKPKPIGAVVVSDLHCGSNVALWPPDGETELGNTVSFGKNHHQRWLWDVWQNVIETAKAHIRSKVEHPFRVIKQQFGFQKTRLRGLVKNRCKINVMAALTNLFLARRQLLATG